MKVYRHALLGFLPIVSLAVGVCIRAWNMNLYSMDIDEVFSVDVASRPWSDLVDAAAADISHPPLIYVLLKLSLTLCGPTVGCARLLPVLLGSAALVAAWWVCRQLRLRAQETALALFLLAVSAYFIYFSQHIRDFVLLQLTGTLCLGSLLRFISAKQVSNLGIAALIVANAAMVYSHYWGWLQIAAAGIIVLAVARRRLMLFAAVALAVIVLSLPWIYLVSESVIKKGSATSQIAWEGTPGIVDFVWYIATVNGIQDFERSTTIGIVLFFSPILVFAWTAVRRALSGQVHDLSLLFILGVWAMFTPLVTLVGSMLMSTAFFGSRHMTACAAAYVILVAIAVWRLPVRWLAGFVAVSVVIWAVSSSVFAIPNINEKIQFEEIVEHIRAHDASADADILVYSYDAVVVGPIRFYAQRMPGRPLTIRIERDLTAIKDRVFWLVYRYPARQGFLTDGLEPDEWFSSRGATIAHSVSATTVVDPLRLRVVMVAR